MLTIETDTYLTRFHGRRSRVKIPFEPLWSRSSRPTFYESLKKRKKRSRGSIDEIDHFCEPRNIRYFVYRILLFISARLHGTLRQKWTPAFVRLRNFKQYSQIMTRTWRSNLDIDIYNDVYLYHQIALFFIDCKGEKNGQ